MADGRVSGTLPSAHTWLLWDEVTAVILACTPDPFANTIASYHEPKNQRVLKLMNNSSCLMNHFSDFWNTFNCGSIFFRFLSPPLLCLQFPSSPVVPLFSSPSLFFSLWAWFIWPGATQPEGKHQAIFVGCRGWTCFMVDGWRPGILCWVSRSTSGPPVSSPSAPTEELIWFKSSSSRLTELSKKLSTLFFGRKIQL